MKKLNHFLVLSKETYSLFAVIFCIFFFVNCRQEQQDSQDLLVAKNNVEDEVRSFYDALLNEVRKAKIDASKSDARFNALNFTPDWDNAIKHSKTCATLWEIPVKFANNGVLASSSGKIGDTFDPKINTAMLVRLIIRKSNGGMLSAEFMVLVPEKYDPNMLDSDFNLFKKISNFTGREYLWNVK